MTYLIERLADLRLHLGHLRDIRARVLNAEVLRADLSLHNDVLFSLLVVCQAVIDVAGDLLGRRGIRFQDYTEAVRALRGVEGMPPEVVAALEGLPGFRNVLVHEYVSLDYALVLDALDGLDAVERFVAIVARLEGDA